MTLKALGRSRDWANEPTKQTNRHKRDSISRADSRLMLGRRYLQCIWINLYVINDGIILLDHIVDHPMNGVASMRRLCIVAVRSITSCDLDSFISL